MVVELRYEHSRASRISRWFVGLMLGLLLAPELSAQELAPRAYWPAPDGTDVFIVSGQYSSGDVLIDPSLPLTGVESRNQLVQLAFQRTFSWFQRTASFQLSAPYAFSYTEGDIDGEFRTRRINGFSDLRARLAINLVGAPSMNREDFAVLRAHPRTIVGASLLVQAPTGQYDVERLINLGTNRWSVKPAIGVIWPLRPEWLLEFEVGAWLFTDNDEFLGGRREQDPILSTEFHLIRRIRPGFWASLDGNFYVGGRTTVDGERSADLQRNSRLGFTVVFPFKRQHAIRASFSTGTVTESGGDFRSLSASYIYAW